jgi:hypothetical protein
MGTTVSTNLGLIKPDEDESIKANMPTFAGWAAQNTINMDKIDALFRAATASYTLNWTADTTNPTLGAGGFTEGKYVRFMPRMVIVFFRLNVGGAGALAGTGTYRFNLPTGLAAELALTDDSVPVGKAVYLDTSAVGTSSNMLVCIKPSTSNMFLRPSQGGEWSGTTPVALGQNDKISGYLIYPTADA